TNASLSNTTITLSGFSFYTSINFSSLNTVRNKIQEIITNNSFTANDFTIYVQNNPSTLRSTFINNLSTSVSGPGSWNSSWVNSSVSFNGSSLTISLTLPNNYKYSWTSTSSVSFSNNTFTFSNFSWYTPTPTSYFNWSGSKITGLSSAGANQTSIVIPNNCTALGYYAFRNNSKITSVTIPASVTAAENAVFENCSNLTSVTFKSGFNAISPYMFNNCTKLSSVSFPDSITSIPEWAFQNNDSISSISIPSAVTSIGNYAFSSCQNLITVSISSTRVSIGEGSFGYNPSLGNVYFYNITSSSNLTLNRQSFYDSRTGYLNVRTQALVNYIVGLSLEHFLGTASSGHIRVF
ncbi:MAG: leucine-rich repeat domain-containing protein, partial [Ureaplasma sp.]|nr:leucine-rich repeat domain-containing protein [Ureaplasma sp.]